ncbi:MAG: pyruvoyl-dependent arginine decarboxylase [Candidatus Altiarchaeales archaeon]|nr:MAG: pyruvoyl-dependent arginine decarboxylase [Candidatus Altiarchaeales archaeon]
MVSKTLGRIIESMICPLSSISSEISILIDLIQSNYISVDKNKNDKMNPLPEKFFLTSGKGLSEISIMNAFDSALVDSGIGECNIVPVSSILPEGAEEIEPIPIEPGTITFTVLSRIHATSGRISAGIGYALSNKKFGIVAEDNNETEEEVRVGIQKKLHEMARLRKIKLGKIKIRTESLSIPEGKFGCVLAALVYVF